MNIIRDILFLTSYTLLYNHYLILIKKAYTLISENNIWCLKYDSWYIWTWLLTNGKKIKHKLCSVYLCIYVQLDFQLLEKHLSCWIWQFLILELHVHLWLILFIWIILIYVLGSKCTFMAFKFRDKQDEMRCHGNRAYTFCELCMLLKVRIFKDIFGREISFKLKINKLL